MPIAGRQARGEEENVIKEGKIVYSSNPYIHSLSFLSMAESKVYIINTKISLNCLASRNPS